MKIWKKLKHDLTSGTWQDDTGCPISIILVSTSDVPSALAYRTDGCCVASRRAAASCAYTPLIRDSVRHRLLPLPPPYPSCRMSPSTPEREWGLPEHCHFRCNRASPKAKLPEEPYYNIGTLAHPWSMRGETAHGRSKFKKMGRRRWQDHNSSCSWQRWKTLIN